MFVRDINDEKREPAFLASLGPGSCFNLVSSFLGRPSIFDYVVPKSYLGKTNFLILKYSELKKMSNRKSRVARSIPILA